MGWLARLSFGKGGTALAEAEREDAESMASGPPLMVLVNDASGRASFKTHVFDDAESATEWVRYWFPKEAADGVTAFWALTAQPEGGIEAAEAVAMIRDTSRDGVVYLFSFVDMNSAQTFLRDEVTRGTKLDAMLLYWAVQVKRETDRWGKLILTPSTPPGVAAYDPEVEGFENDGWAVQEAPVAERAPAKPAGNARALMEEAPNARTGVAEPNGPGQETFELTSWMERARKSRSRQRDVVEIAAEVVAASEESFEEVRAIAAEPEPVFEDAVAVEATVQVEPESVIEDGVVVEAAVEAEPEAVIEHDVVVAVAVESAPKAVIEDKVVVEAAVEAEPEAVIKDAVVVEAAVEAEPKAVIEDAVLVEAQFEEAEAGTVVESEAAEEASEHAEARALTQAVSEAEESEAENRDLKARASTKGNGHKSPLAHEVVVEINGHKSSHEAAEPIGGESPEAEDGPRNYMLKETPPSTNGNTAANGHAAQVTSLNGEGVPAAELQLDNSDAEAGDTVDKAPDIVHDVRIEAATNGRDETISIQIGIHLQSRALRMKRWEVKDEPFEGFKSPPGKF